MVDADGKQFTDRGDGLTGSPGSVQIVRGPFDQRSVQGAMG